MAPDPPYAGRAMLNTSRNRALAAHLVDPVAKALLRMKIAPGVVTAIGALGAVVASTLTFPRGAWIAGVLWVSVFAVSDLLDGTMARLSGQSSQWGAFLDSTLDRVTDAALSVSILWGLHLLPDGTAHDVAIASASVSLVAGQVVPYAKARAESLGVSCDVGLAERAERVVLMLLSALLIGLEQMQFATAALVLVAAATVITVCQRILHVRKALT